MQTIRDKNAFLPISLLLIYTLLVIFESIGLNSTQGYIYQLVLASFALVYVSTHHMKRFHVISIMLGFLFCFIGDLFLAGAFKDFIDSSLRMPLGMAGFFLGHIWWFIALLFYRERFDRRKVIFMFSIVYVVILLLWAFLVFNNNHMLLSILALVYSLGIAAPFALSLSLIKEIKTYMFLMIGYASLIFSDLLIAMRDIKGLDPFTTWHDDIVWFTYLLGIGAITYFFVSYKKIKTITSEN